MISFEDFWAQVLQRTHGTWPWKTLPDGRVLTPGNAKFPHENNMKMKYIEICSWCILVYHIFLDISATKYGAMEKTSHSWWLFQFLSCLTLQNCEKLKRWLVLNSLVIVLRQICVAPATITQFPPPIIVELFGPVWTIRCQVVQVKLQRIQVLLTTAGREAWDISNIQQPSGTMVTHHKLTVLLNSDHKTTTLLHSASPFWVPSSGV